MDENKNHFRGKVIIIVFETNLHLPITINILQILDLIRIGLIRHEKICQKTKKA